MTNLSGILWEKGKWKVQISFQGRRYYLGRFNKIEDAIEIKKTAEEAKNSNFLEWYQETYSGRSKDLIDKYDLTDKYFGYIHVLSKTNTSKNGGIIWKCQCKCGNIIYLSTNKIISGDTKSCGCIRDDMNHKASRKNAKCISYEKGKRSPYRARIMRFNKNYYLGMFMEESDAENMVLIAKTFSDMDDFLKWYNNRKEIYNWLCDKCSRIKMPCDKIIQSIYDGFYGEIYNNLIELDQYIDDFKIGYET